MPSKQLLIVRIGLIAGVFAFAGIAIYQQMQGIVPLGISETFPLDALRYVLWAVVALSALATLFLRMKVESAAPAQRGVLILVGWTFGEGAALLGVVLHFAGGAMSSLWLGVIAFVFALLMLPVPSSQN